MNGYSLGCYEKAMPASLTMRQKLCEARQAGFDFLELSIDESDEKLARLDWTAQQKKEISMQMHEEGFFLRSICLSGHRRFPLGSEDAQVRERGMEIMRKAIDFADEMGIRIIQIAGYDEYYHPSSEITQRNFEENLARSVELAAQKGVILAFETMETAFMNTVEKAMRHVRRVQSPYLQVYPDSGNITNAGGDVCADLRSGSGHIAAIHLKETSPSVFREVAYGSGHVPFVPLIATAMQMGVRRYLAEFWCVPQVDWKRQMHEANAFLRNRFMQAQEGTQC